MEGHGTKDNTDKKGRQAKATKLDLHKSSKVQQENKQPGLILSCMLFHPYAVSIYGEIYLVTPNYNSSASVL